MNYWWVNQKQTYRHEVGDGYMWSPKRQQDGDPHFSYEYMKHIEPGDIIFSYANAEIIAVGIARTHCYSFPKPLEFGKTGYNWSNEGWKVDVHYRMVSSPVRTIDYRMVSSPVRTIDHIDVLRSYLPQVRSPIRPENGYANQAYLFQIDKTFALALAQLINQQTVDLVNSNIVEESTEVIETISSHIEGWENVIENEIIRSPSISETEKDTLVKSRRGQGKYREQLLLLEPKCRITGVNNPEHLVASHIKPWRSSENDERLDPDNGFMLTPSIDHLFDKGFIGFESNGSILLADVANRDAMERMGVIGKNAPVNIGAVREGQKRYLDWHRDNILL
jgi:hypothetical protein